MTFKKKKNKVGRIGLERLGANTGSVAVLNWG